MALELAELRSLQGEAGILRVGFGVAVLARGLPEVILRFRRRYPAIHLSVKNMSTSDQLQALTDRTIDVGFVRLPVTSDDIEAVPVLNERLMIVLGKQHADVQDGLSALLDAPFILPCRADSVSFYDHVFRTCRAAGLVPKVVQETDVSFTALNLVRAGLASASHPARFSSCGYRRFGLPKRTYPRLSGPLVSPGIVDLLLPRC